VTTKPLKSFVSGLNFSERGSLLLIALRKLESHHAQTERPVPTRNRYQGLLVFLLISFFCFAF
jgi:hypothetical protein